MRPNAWNDALYFSVDTPATNLVLSTKKPDIFSRHRRTAEHEHKSEIKSSIYFVKWQHLQTPQHIHSVKKPTFRVTNIINIYTYICRYL